MSQNKTIKAGLIIPGNPNWYARVWINNGILKTVDNKLYMLPLYFDKATYGAVIQGTVVNFSKPLKSLNWNCEFAGEFKIDEHFKIISVREPVSN